jgi:hypothetical protein
VPKAQASRPRIRAQGGSRCPNNAAAVVGYVSLRPATDAAVFDQVREKGG